MDDSNKKLFGGDLFGGDAAPKGGGPLAKRFKFPPFTTWSARDGAWQERKRAWLALGIESELGRGLDAGGDDLLFSSQSQSRLNEIMAQKSSPGGSRMPATDYGKGERGDGKGRPAGGMEKGLTYGEFNPDISGPKSGTSIFDPVVCELAYSWFCPPGGEVLDPFAGGSVRGIVASKLGRHYHGIDLRPEQVKANRAQAEELCGAPIPVWIEGDSVRLADHYPGGADFIFSCPPYGNLEVYSDDPADLSAMDWGSFTMAYTSIIGAAVAALAPDRFACFVVGDFQCPKGNYRNFPGLTVSAFQAAGAALYNEAILLTAIGSLPVRVSSQFDVSRKLGKAHQNILVFVKGDARAAATACMTDPKTKGEGDG